MTRTLALCLRFRCVELALYLLRGTDAPVLVDELADVCAACGDVRLAGGGVA